MTLNMTTKISVRSMLKSILLIQIGNGGLNNILLIFLLINITARLKKLSNCLTVLNGVAGILSSLTRTVSRGSAWHGYGAFLFFGFCVCVCVLFLLFFLFFLPAKANLK